MTDTIEPWTPTIGQQVVVTSKKEWASDWVDAAGEPLALFVAGVRALAGGGVDVTVTDEWPIRARPRGSELTDGFIVGRDEQDDLTPYPALTLNVSVPAELVERALDALERGDWDLGDVGVIRAALAATPPAGRVEELERALVQAAVPLEAMLASRQSVDLPDTSWAEIENAVKHIRAALSGEGM